MRRLAALLLAMLALVLVAGPAAAENPVLDPEDDAEIVDALAEATALQEVCYGYVLDVRDGTGSGFGGTYGATSSGIGDTIQPATCPRGSVVLYATLTYTSESSEAQDSASWSVDSTLGGPSTVDLAQQGLSAEDLTDDAKAATTLRNAVLALPGLTAAQQGLPPVVAQPNTAPLPPDAGATGSPGSDWVRESTGLLVLCGLLIGGAVLVFVLSFRTVRGTLSALSETSG